MKNTCLFYFYSLLFSKASVECSSIDLCKWSLDFQFLSTMVVPFNCCVNTNWHRLDYISTAKVWNYLICFKAEKAVNYDFGIKFSTFSSRLKLLHNPGSTSSDRNLSNGMIGMCTVQKWSCSVGIASFPFK